MYSNNLNQKYQWRSSREFDIGLENIDEEIQQNPTSESGDEDTRSPQAPPSPMMTKHRLTKAEKPETITATPKVNKVDAHLILPGGALFLFWQFGVLSYLHEEFDMSRVAITGASSGAVAAACSAVDVDMRALVHKAIEKSKKHNLWGRPMGVVGVLGKIVEECLEEVLPEDAATKMTNHHVSVLIQPLQASFPRQGVERVSNFRSRGSVVRALTASAHIPWVFNGKATGQFRGKKYVDGAIFASEKDYTRRNSILAPAIIKLDHNEDPSMKANKNLLDCVRTRSEEDFWEMFEMGRLHGKRMDAQGAFFSMTRRNQPHQPPAVFTPMVADHEQWDCIRLTAESALN